MTRIKILVLSLFLAMGILRPVAAQVDGLAVSAPRSGDVLQGTVTITGSSQVDGFSSYEIAFTYSGGASGNWFVIARSDQSIQDGTLAVWDTTTITDGTYDLRLRVYLTDGTSQEVVVPQLRVHNYTAVETPTPAAISPAETRVPTQTPSPTSTPTATPFPTPTALPANPAILTPVDVSTSILFGGAAAVLGFLLFGAYLWLRRK